MTIEIDWKHIGNDEKYWEGKGIGLWSLVVFTIRVHDIQRDEYLVEANVRQISGKVCLGLENAKQTAQSILNSYAISQAIL